MFRWILGDITSSKFYENTLRFSRVATRGLMDGRTDEGRYNI